MVSLFTDRLYLVGTHHNCVNIADPCLGSLLKAFHRLPWVQEVVVVFFVGRGYYAAELRLQGAKRREDKNNLWSLEFWTSFPSCRLGIHAFPKPIRVFVSCRLGCCFIWRNNQRCGNEFLCSCDQRAVSRLLFGFQGYLFSQRASGARVFTGKLVTSCRTDVKPWAGTQSYSLYGPPCGK